jgi:hypothetical protein
MIIINLFSLFYLDTSKSQFFLFLIGFLLPLVNIAKDQTLFISISLELLFIIYLISISRLDAIISLLFGNSICILVMIFPILLFDTQDDFFQQLEVRINLSREGWFNKNLNIFWHFYGILSQLKNSFVFFFYLLVSVGLIFKLEIKNLLRKSSHKKPVVLLIISTTGIFSCFFTYMKTSSVFSHQFLYLLPFATILIPLFVNFLLEVKFKYNFVVFYFILYTLSIYSFYRNKNISSNIKAKLCYNEKFGFINSKKFSDVISSNLKTNDRLIVWGWDNSYYIENELMSGSRYPNIASLYDKISSVNSRNKMISKYMYDINTLKPRFIVEAVGIDEFFTKNEDEFGISRYRNVYNIIMTKYCLLEHDKYRKLFIRKN